MLRMLSAVTLLTVASPLWAEAEPGAEPEPEPGAEPEPGTEPELSEITAALAAPTEPLRPAAAAPATPQLIDVALIADLVAAAFSDAGPVPPLPPGGAHDPTGNGPALQHLELSLGKAVDPYFRFDAAIVFGEEEVEVEEAYATTLALPGRLQLRAGQFLSRFGRHNAQHPHQWELIDQPLLLGRVFGGEGGRGVGVEISYLTPLPWFAELVAAVTTADGEGSARSFLGANQRPIESARDLVITAATKHFFDLSDDWSLLAGLSYAGGPDGRGVDARAHLLGGDFYLKWRPISRGGHTQITLQGEAVVRRRWQLDGAMHDVTGYLQAMWRRYRWGAGARYEVGGAVTGAGAAGDPLDPDWTSARHRAALVATFWPSEFSRLRWQGGVDAPGWFPDPIWSTFVSAEFVIGAHGAHTF